MRVISAIASGITLWALAACAPVYETQYRYTPPANADGRACAAQCQSSQLQCRDSEEAKADNRRLRCESIARDDYERCLSTATTEQGRSACQRRLCSEPAKAEICEADYRSCYATCGGAVEATQVCTFNCNGH